MKCKYESIVYITSWMCARDGHIYHESLLFLESQDLQNHLVEDVFMAKDLSGSF